MGSGYGGVNVAGTGALSGYTATYAPNAAEVAQGANISILSPISLQVGSVAAIDGNGCFIGPQAKPIIGGTQYNGGTFTFQDLAGVTHTVKGGFVIS